MINVKDDPSVAGDGATDDRDAIQTIITNNPTEEIFFPRTATSAGGVSYLLSGSLTVSSVGQVLRGEAGGYFDGTILQFPEGVPGIIIKPAAAGASIRDLVLLGSEAWQQVFYYEGVLPAGFGGTNVADGVQVGANFTRLENVFVARFGRHGFNLANSDFEGGTGVSDECTLINCSAFNCRGYGLYTQGGDANASLFMNLSVGVCQLGGIREYSFLGNTYVAPNVAECHFDNAQGSVAPLANLASISRSSNVVTLTFTAPYVDTPLSNVFKIGQGVTVVGVSDASFNGTFIVTNVSGAVLTYSQAGADASVSGSGQARMAKMIETWSAAGLHTEGSYITTDNTSNRTVWVNLYEEGGQNALGDPNLPCSRFGSSQTVTGGMFGGYFNPSYGVPFIMGAGVAGVGHGFYSFPSVRWLSDTTAQYQEWLGKTATQTKRRYLKTFNGATTLWREEEGPNWWRLWSRDPDQDASAIIRLGADLAPGAYRTYVNSEQTEAVQVNLLAGSGTGGLVVGDGAGNVVATITAKGTIKLTPIVDADAGTGTLFRGSQHGNRLCFKDDDGTVTVLGPEP